MNMKLQADRKVLKRVASVAVAIKLQEDHEESARQAYMVINLKEDREESARVASIAVTMKLHADCEVMEREAGCGNTRGM